MNTQFDPEQLRTAPYPHDGHLDGDADGLGAFRGMAFAFLFTGALIGLAFLVF